VSGAPAKPAIRVPRTTEAQETAARIRRCRRIERALLVDRGNDPTEAQTILAQNAAGLAIWLEEQVCKMLNGPELGSDIDIGQINSSMNTLRRLLETLGIERRPRDVTSLTRYLDEHAGKVVNGDHVS
jgi:hypothetical protein